MVEVRFGSFYYVTVKAGGSVMHVHFDTTASIRIETPYFDEHIHLKFEYSDTDAINYVIELMKREDAPMLAFIGMFDVIDYHVSRYVKEVMKYYLENGKVPEKLPVGGEVPPRRYDTVKNIKRTFKKAVKGRGASYILSVHEYLLKLPAESRVRKALKSGIMKLLSSSI